MAPTPNPKTAADSRGEEAGNKLGTAGGDENRGHADWSGRKLPAICLSSPTMAVLKRQKKQASLIILRHILGHFRVPYKGTEMLHAL